MRRAVPALVDWIWRPRVLAALNSPLQRNGVTFLSAGGANQSIRWYSYASEFAQTISSKPRSLEVGKPPMSMPPQFETWWAKALLTVTGFYSKKSQLHQGGLDMFATIKRQSQQAELYQVFGLDREQFMSQYWMLALHMWLLIVRLRGAGQEAGFFRQQMYDCFQQDVEQQVYSRVQVHPRKWITKLEGIFYGSGITFDKSVRGEGMPLPDALLKNVYGGDPLHRQHADILAKYLLRELECLQLTSTEAILRGALKFSSALPGDAEQTAGSVQSRVPQAAATLH